MTAEYDHQQAHAWLSAQYDPAPGLIAVVSTLDWSGEQFETADQAAEYVAQLDKRGAKGIYARVTTVRSRLPAGKRGSAEDSLALIDMWSDIDIKGPGHKAENLPADGPAAVQIWRESGLPAWTQKISSGGGLYLRASLDRPAVIGQDLDLDEAQHLARSWQQILKASADRLGVEYGAGVGDVPRVLRIPGTINGKVPDHPRLCTSDWWATRRTAIDTSAPRYTLDEIRQFIADLAPKPKPRPPRPERPAPGERRQPSGEHTGRGPLEILGEHYAVPHVLEAAGWTYLEQTPGTCPVCTGGECQRWVYPGWDRHVNGTGATVHKGGACITIWSETPGLPTGEVMSAGRLFAELHHRGDQSAASIDILRAGHGRTNATPAARALPAQILTEIKDASIERKPMGDRDTNDRNGFEGTREGGESDSVNCVTVWEEPIPVDRPPLPRFPVDALGSNLASMVRAVADEIQVAVDLPAMIAVPAITTAIGGRIRIRIRSGWAEASSLWTATVAGPGERKSAAEAAFTDPLKRAEKDLREKAAPDIEDAEQSVRIAKGRLDEAERAAIKAKPEHAELKDSEAKLARKALAELGEVPKPPRVLFGDITPAAMPLKASENAGRMAVLHSEGTLFKNLSGMYNNGVSDTGFALDAYDGKAVPVDRVQRVTTEMDTAHLTVGLLIQPVILEQLGRKRDNEMLHNGFVQRFLYSSPISSLGRQDPRLSKPVPHDVATGYEARICDLVTRLWASGDTREIRFTAEADEHMYVFQEAMQPRLRNGGDLHPIASWASKLPGKLARIAAALTLYDDPGAAQITGECVSRVLGMAPYFIAHARVCLDLMGANREAKLTPARDVLAWLRREKQSKPFSVRDAHRGLHGRSWVDEGGADAVKDALTHLEDLGWVALMPVEETPGRRGRKPSPKYDIHPWVCNPPAKKEEEADRGRDTNDRNPHPPQSTDGGSTDSRPTNPRIPHPSRPADANHSSGISGTPIDLGPNVGPCAKCGTDTIVHGPIGNPHCLDCRAAA